MKIKFCRFKINITLKKGKETKIQSNTTFARRGSNSIPTFLKSVTEVNCEYFSCKEQGSLWRGFTVVLERRSVRISAGTPHRFADVLSNFPRSPQTNAEIRPRIGEDRFFPNIF